MLATLNFVKITFLAAAVELHVGAASVSGTWPEIEFLLRRILNNSMNGWSVPSREPVCMRSAESS